MVLARPVIHFSRSQASHCACTCLKRLACASGEISLESSFGLRVRGVIVGELGGVQVMYLLTETLAVSLTSICQEEIKRKYASLCFHLPPTSSGFALCTDGGK
jgi:hypothetical protein